MAQDEQEPHSVCAQPPPQPIVLPEGLSPGRESAIRLVKNKWVNGTVLHYFFVDAPRAKWSDPQREVVRWAFKTWKDVGIGLSFNEVDSADEAELRIGFDQKDGSWSYVGTDVLTNESRGRTMNYGWDLTSEWGHATALHEIGHALGMPHEHQNPLAGIIWNEEVVYATFAGSPNNWDREKTFTNILRKIPRSDVEGSNWDPASIMHYPFGGGLISAPTPYDVQGIGRNTVLSDNDKAWVRKFYPDGHKAKPIEVMQLQPLPTDIAAQKDFLFKPDTTRAYTIQTVGASDIKIVVFEERDDEPRHLAAEDDSGVEANGVIVAKLVKGRRYFVRVRTHFVSSPSGVGLLIF